MFGFVKLIHAFDGDSVPLIGQTIEGDEFWMSVKIVTDWFVGPADGIVIVIADNGFGLV